MQQVTHKLRVVRKNLNPWPHVKQKHRSDISITRLTALNVATDKNHNSSLRVIDYAQAKNNKHTS